MGRGPRGPKRALWDRRYAENLRTYLLKVLGGAGCVVCGCKEKIEFAHLKPTGLNGRSRGRNRRLQDVKRNPGSYTLLCRQHHRMLDRGEALE